MIRILYAALVAIRYGKFVCTRRYIPHMYRDVAGIRLPDRRYRFNL